MKSIERLLQETKELSNDEERWIWLIENKNEPNLPPLSLDNDDTFMWFVEVDELYPYLQFEDYIGNDYGLKALLKATGIKAVGV